MTYSDGYKIARADFESSSLLPHIEFEGVTVACGHSRLVTNGNSDNQPVSRDGIIVLHNGIIVNAEDVSNQTGITLNQEIDTEIIAALFAKKLTDGLDVGEIPKIVMSYCTGVVAAAVAIPALGKLVLFSNNGSLYVGDKKRRHSFFI